MMKEFNAYAYLKQVLSNWEEFCSSHKRFALAIDIIVNENLFLKEQIAYYQNLLQIEMDRGE